jgi:hypothetical protein
MWSGQDVKHSVGCIHVNLLENWSLGGTLVKLGREPLLHPNPDPWVGTFVLGWWGSSRMTADNFSYWGCLRRAGGIISREGSFNRECTSGRRGIQPLNYRGVNMWDQNKPCFQ